MAKLKGKDLLSLADLTKENIKELLNQAGKLKKRKRSLTATIALRPKVLAMIFQKPSTRTRISFETAMHQLGGHAINLSWHDLQVSRGETIEDTARVMSRYVDAIMARVNLHSDIIKLAENATVPVINGLSDLYHPCQILADFLTILERRKQLEGLKVAYVGDGNNVCNTLLVGCSRVGMDISVAHPEGYGPSAEAVGLAGEFSKSSGTKVELTMEPETAARDADVIYTDTFVSMGQEGEKDRKLNVFLPKYQVTEKTFQSAKPDAIFMHCLPAHRGEEVAGDVIDGPRSVVWDEAENRLHIQKAILLSLIG
ncbi:ornithine carbamoyltransferase [Candidatus Bathyarchaeota archaeon]|nr:ornithine carbamoyltransferase [Candidatus Bathyarchaeota archaeon]